MKIGLFLIMLVLTASPSESLQWFHEYEQALVQAKATGKPIFIDCFADWCLWCHKMEQEVYSDARFIALMQKYIPLRIDIEDGAEGSRIATQYQVESLPTLLIVLSDGKMINRIGGYLDAETLVGDVTRMEQLIERERVDPNDWVAVQNLAEEYLFRDMNADAEARFTRILQASISETTKESAHFSLALAQYYQQKNDQALATLGTYRETYPDGRSMEEALLLLSQIYLEMDAHDKTKQILQEFLRKFPHSKSVNRAREVLKNLE